MNIVVMEIIIMVNNVVHVHQE